jgi:predicted DNA-binding transcriptional regulator AlpA
MKRSDLVPFKVVVEEMGLSRASIWRAAQSDIPGFPKPVIIRRLVYWKKAVLTALEDALFRYKGRIAFGREREASRKIAAMKRAKAAAPRKRPQASAPRPQRDLFSD